MQTPEAPLRGFSIVLARGDAVCYKEDRTVINR